MSFAIQHVHVKTHDPQKTMQFYIDNLGATYVAEIPGIERIRYTTSHPNEFTQRLVDVYAINSSVDVIKIGGKLPFEPGYPLHGN